MTAKTIMFALLATFIALAYSGWEEFTYAMTPAQKRGWFIAASVLVIGVLAYLLRPFVVKHFM